LIERGFTLKKRRKSSEEKIRRKRRDLPGKKGRKGKNSRGSAGEKGRGEGGEKKSFPLKGEGFEKFTVFKERERPLAEERVGVTPLHMVSEKRGGRKKIAGKDCHESLRKRNRHG